MLVINQRLTITRGEDKNFIFKLRGGDSRDPVDLTGITSIKVEFTKSNRGSLILDNLMRPEIKARAEVGDITFVANHGGGKGNSISLYFDGTEDIDTVVNNWNASNPENQLSHDGIGDEVIEGEIQLSGGIPAYREVSVEGNPVLGKIKIIMNELDTIQLRRGNNQSIKVTLDWDHPPAGIRRITRFDNKLDVIDSI